MDFLRNLFDNKQPADTSSAIADENTVFLQAEPISRKRMNLLWLNPPQLAQIQQQLTQHKVVDVIMSDSPNSQNYEITQEDYEWAKQIERVVDKAYSAFQCENYKESIQHYKKALELAPGCDLFLMSIGACYALLGEKAKGVQYLERAAQISPGNSRIRDNLNQVRQSPIKTKHPPLPSTPQPSTTRQCPQCGSLSLGEQKVTLTATRAVDRTRRIERKFDATRLYCKQCGLILNDDLRGDKARAYSGLVGDVRSSFDIDGKVTEVMQGARNLPEISDADVDKDFEDIREVWNCLKVVTIPEQDLQSTVLQLIWGYAQEGASDLQVTMLDQNILQINFFFDNLTFEGVRIARFAVGSFAAYGFASMYRLVGSATPGTQNNNAAQNRSEFEDMIDELLEISRTEGFLSATPGGKFDSNCNNIRARAIGQRLDEAGGIQWMQAAHSRIRLSMPGPAQDLEYAWDRIGGWQT